MAVSWPSIQKASFITGGDIVMAQVRTSFEKGYAQARKKYTMPVRTWNLSWNAMPDADWTTLSSFFVTNQSALIDWTYKSVVYTVGFLDDSISYSPSGPTVWQVSLSLGGI